LSSLAKTILAFHVIKNIKIIVANWLTEYCHTGNFSFPVLILKYFNLKNYSANFVQNCTIYSKEVLLNEINGIINSDKFSRSYNDPYFDVTFIQTHGNGKFCLYVLNLYLL